MAWLQVTSLCQHFVTGNSGYHSLKSISQWIDQSATAILKPFSLGNLSISLIELCVHVTEVIEVMQG